MQSEDDEAAASLSEYLQYRRPTGAAPPAASQGARTQAGTDEHSAMTSQGVTPGQKRQLVCTSQPECKRQDTGDSEDESTIIEDDNVANLSDLDINEGGFRIVCHRKDRAEGIQVLITAASERADLRQVKPIVVYSELETILGGAPVKSHFTAQGALLLDVETEGQANILLETKNIGGIAISARVPHSYMKNMCIVRRVPKWYSDEELLTFLRPQGVFHARRIIRRVQTSPSEWESRRTNSVVLTFAPNSERPEKINLGFTRQELVDYVDTPPRCFKCQRFGHIAKYCRGEHRCKRCGGPHNFKRCASKENSVCANCGGDHPASYGRCPARTAAHRRNKMFVLGPKNASAQSNTKKTLSVPQLTRLERDYASDFPRLTPINEVIEPTQTVTAAEKRSSLIDACRHCSAGFVTWFLLFWQRRPDASS
ncbi:hypothetical protein HPB49_009320 [Dermacentor silvarum]|uniref:Uncharacterized protein n=1 Tax=Dermacentor silvarum TaxID=543639 RepID=A0ACB8CWI5_DERSI|nr:hypothetical protein HPB49_009320 [Dermacentor silvarum]